MSRRAAGSAPAEGPRIGVSALVTASGRVLVVRRALPPLAGAWALPGGRVERGERLAAAVAREVQEECGLTVDVGALVAASEVVGDDHHWVVLVHRAEVVGGELVAGDDAAEARFVTRGELAELERVPGLLALVDGALGWDADALQRDDDALGRGAGAGAGDA